MSEPQGHAAVTMVVERLDTDYHDGFTRLTIRVDTQGIDRILAALRVEKTFPGTVYLQVLPLEEKT